MSACYASVADRALNRMQRCARERRDRARQCDRMVPLFVEAEDMEAAARAIMQAKELRRTAKRMEADIAADERDQESAI